jgi:hypothetical protein
MMYTMLSNIVSLATLVAVAYYLRRSGVGWTPTVLVACCTASSLALCVASMVGIRNLRNKAKNLYIDQNGQIRSKPTS